MWTFSFFLPCPLLLSRMRTLGWTLLSYSVRSKYTPHPSLSPCLGYNPCLMWHCCEDRYGGDRWLNTGRLSVERALSLYPSKHLQMCSKGNVNIYSLTSACRLSMILRMMAQHQPPATSHQHIDALCFILLDRVFCFLW